MITLAELAHSQQLQYQGDGEIELHSVGTLEHAKNHQISFLSNPKYTQYLTSSHAGAVILTEKAAAEFKGNALISNDPYLTFAHVAQYFYASHTESVTANSVHNTAVLDETVRINEPVLIGPLTTIAAGVNIGQQTKISAHVTIGKNVQIGKNCLIKPGVVIEADCIIGDRVIIHPGAVIGADGFGMAKGKDGWVKIPQIGAVVIGNDCEIGANTTIDCGAIDNTVLGNDVRLDNQIQIGHNVVIGDHTVIAGCTAVAGSTTIGKNCFIAGGVGIVGHISICDGVTVQAMALVTHSIKQADSYSSAAPLQPTKQWRKNAVRARQLDQLARKINKLEKLKNV